MKYIGKLFGRLTPKRAVREFDKSLCIVLNVVLEVD